MENKNKDLNLHAFVYNKEGLIVQFAIIADETDEGIIVMEEVEDEVTGKKMFEVNILQEPDLAVVQFDIKGNSITHFYDKNRRKVPYHYKLTDDVAYAVRSNTAFWINNKIVLNLN